MIKATKIDLTAVLPMLSEPRAASLIATVAGLEAAVAAGRVPNKLLTDAKFIINRRVEESAEKFLAAGPHVEGRNGQPHDQSDWWLEAYDHDAFVHGASNIASGLKRAKKAPGLAAYATFLTALLPLNELLQAAKPLIVKRGDGPTEKQIAAAKAREGHAMTCQCCGRDIFAERGKIAHHGYERPGDGFQTASCMGALYAPFEANRNRLGAMIKGLTSNRDGRIADREDVVAEKRDIAVGWTNYKKRDNRGRPVEERTYVNRLNFAEVVNGELKEPLRHRQIESFDELKRIEIADIDARIKHLNERIAYEQARYDGWKQTHEFVGRKWKEIA